MYNSQWTCYSGTESSFIEAHWWQWWFTCQAWLWHRENRLYISQDHSWWRHTDEEKTVSSIVWEAVGKQIKYLVEHGVIRESNSPWAFPIIVIRKKNGKRRICVDYRLLNDHSEKFYWPLGSIDIFASLGGARYLSSLDNANAYHHIPLVEEDIPKTAFICEHQPVLEPSHYLKQYCIIADWALGILFQWNLN